MIFFGTLAVEGKGKGIVAKTGDNTMMGQIAKLTIHTKTTTSPINKEIHHFVMIITAIALFLGALFLIFGAIKGKDAI